MRARLRNQRRPAIDVVADQVFHGHARTHEPDIAKWQAADRANVVLELRGDRAFNRPMPGVMHPRRHFVKHRAVRRGEEFAGENADMIERVGDPAGQRRRFGPMRGNFGRRGHGGAGEDAIGMLVPRRRVADHGAILPTHQHDREFVAEGDEGLKHRGAADDRPRRIGIVG